MSADMLRVAAAQYRIDRLASWSAYRDKVADIAGAAQRGGARLLVFPEYGSMELVSLLPAAVQQDLAAQLAAMQELAGEFVALHAAVASDTGLHVLAPSFPTRQPDGSIRNRAWLFGPDGGRGFQEKLQMTRFEAEQWSIAPGAGLRVFETALGRLGVAICYDAEFPLLVRRQVEAGASVILVPSCTDTLAGYWRVRIAAQARALENQCYVLQSPTVGEAPWSAAVDVNVGAAGAFGPVDSAVAPDGILALGGINRPGLVFADLDLGALDAVRGAGEVLISRDWRNQQRIAEMKVDVGEV